LGVDTAASLDGVLAVEHDRGALTLVTREPADVIARLSELDALAGLQVRSGSLEDVFVSLTGRRLIVDEGPST
jgi:ABC-2 type transport system ATP-binding protein